MPWIAARSSFVGFVCMVASVFFTHCLAGSYAGNFRNGWLHKMLTAQHHEVRAVSQRYWKAPDELARLQGELPMGLSEGDETRELQHLCRLLTIALPPAPPEPTEVIAARMLAEGFTPAALRAAVAHGTLHDLVGTLSLVPKLGLRPGDRLALAAAVRVEAAKHEA